MHIFSDHSHILQICVPNVKKWIHQWTNNAISFINANTIPIPILIIQIENAKTTNIRKADVCYL